MRRYVPRQKPSSLNALSINRKAEELYPDISIGEDVSPDVFMDSIQQDLDQRTGEIQGRRELGKGAVKLGWTLSSKAQKEALKKKISSVPGKAKEIGSKIMGSKSAPSVDALENTFNYRGKGMLGALDRGVTAGKAAGAVARQQAGNFALGFKSSAAKMAGANTAGIGTGTAAGSIGAAVPPLLAAVAISKAIGSTKIGKDWEKFTNRSTKGRFKNLLNPWKWRL
jgi:hypothetical protein